MRDLQSINAEFEPDAAEKTATNGLDSNIHPEDDLADR